MECGDDPLDPKLVSFLCGVGPQRTPVAASDAPSGPARCGGCGATLSGLPLCPGEPFTSVICEACNRWCFVEGDGGRPYSASTGLLAGKTNAAQVHSGANHSLLEELVGAKGQQVERRIGVRHPTSGSVVVGPLDAECQPCGQAWTASMTNVSTGGIELLFKQVAAPRSVAIDFTTAGSAGQQVLARVAWSDALLDYTKLGCEFLHPLGSPPPLQPQK